jgi:hypothetical protein
MNWQQHDDWPSRCGRCLTNDHSMRISSAATSTANPNRITASNSHAFCFGLGH